MRRLLLVLSLVFAVQLSAQEMLDVLEIDSRVMEEKRTVLIRVPPAYKAGSQSYPVLYMTDGIGHIAHTSATVDFLAREGRMRELIVVAINNTDRTRDLTPTRVTGQTFEGQPFDFPTSGGADRFLQFIETEVIPEIEKRYRTQPYRIFAGHSFGGLFAMHALFTRPKLFNAWIAVSPSFTWERGYVERKAKQFVKDHKELNGTLVFTLGNEQGQKAAFDAVKKLFASKAPKGFEVSSYYFDDEDHGSVVMPSHYAGLRKIFESWRFRMTAEDNPLTLYARAVDHYGRVSKRAGFDVGVPENTANVIGYRLLGTGHTREAIEVFRKNVEAFPKSANVYDSLGEAYEKLGNKEEAKAAYHRAWTIGKETNDRNTPVFLQNYERLAKQP